ncbi:MAG: transposase [Rhodospirillaceae bacterium]
MGQVHFITGVERRRRWSDDQKRAVVAAAFAPGTVVSEVARRADVSRGLIYHGRHEFRSSSPGFAQVVVSPALSAPAPVRAPEAMIEIVVGSGSRLRLPAVSPQLASAIRKALVRS